MKLDPDDIEQIAASVARRLADRLDPYQGRRFVDAATLARLLDVERDWIYAHAGELGGVRLGGPRGRLRFDLKALGDRLAPAAPTRAGRRATPRRPRARTAGRPGAEPVRLLPYLVESPQRQRRSGRAARQRPRPDTGRLGPDA
jgi:hypothetical protein